MALLFGLFCYISRAEDSHETSAVIYLEQKKKKKKKNKKLPSAATLLDTNKD